MLRQDINIKCEPIIELCDTLIFYVEPSFDPVTNAYFNASYDKIYDIFSKQGLELIYLPKFKDYEVIKYLTGSNESFGTDPLSTFRAILPDMILNQITCPSLVHYSKERGGFDIVNLDIEKLDELHLNLFLEVNAQAYGYEHRHNKLEVDYCLDGHFSFVEDGYIPIRFCLVDDNLPLKESLDEETRAEINAIDEENREMIENIKTLLTSLESRGLNRELIFKMLSRPMKPSGIRVCKDKIVLSDLNDKEIKLAALDFSFYQLYLRHPEGIRFKDVVDYKEELLGLYKSIQQRRCRNIQEKTILNFVDSTRNLMSISASRIKNAFKAAVNENLANWYCISGGAGDAKLVRLPQNMIEWG